MEKYVVLLWACWSVGWLLLVLVGHAVAMRWQKKKEKKDMGRLKAGSVWRLRRLRNNPFDEDSRNYVTVLETRVNSDGRMWVRYLHSSGLAEMDPADVFVQMYLYVEDQDLGIKGDEVQRMARGMVRIAKQGKNGNKNI